MDSFSPAATRIISSTKSRPATISVTGCSTCSSNRKDGSHSDDCALVGDPANGTEANLAQLAHGQDPSCDPLLSPAHGAPRPLAAASLR
eukprot:scaffold4217_cov27-Tisochrysis_lutea.AAC.4